MTVMIGAPEPRDDSEGAEAAVEMTLEMLARTARLVRTCEELGTEVPFAVQAGIATGYCTVGTFGSLERMQYTAVGGTVELAWHLASGAEPGSVLISHATSGLVRERFDLVSMGEVTFPGLARPIHAYRVGGVKGAPPVELVGHAPG
jgi:class 3 adenylate cyclase